MDLPKFCQTYNERFMKSKQLIVLFAVFYVVEICTVACAHASSQSLLSKVASL